MSSREKKLFLFEHDYGQGSVLRYVRAYTLEAARRIYAEPEWQHLGVEPEWITPEYRERLIYNPYVEVDD